MKNRPRKNFRDQDQDPSIGYMKKDDTTATVYIGNMIYAKDEKDILNMFKKYGYVSFVRINRDKKSNRSKGFAFVQMSNLNEAQEAIKNLDGKEVDGRTLKVSLAIESQKNRPSRKKRR